LRVKYRTTGESFEFRISVSHEMNYVFLTLIVSLYGLLLVSLQDTEPFLKLSYATFSLQFPFQHPPPIRFSPVQKKLKITVMKRSHGI